MGDKLWKRRARVLAEFAVALLLVAPFAFLWLLLREYWRALMVVAREVEATRQRMLGSVMRQWSPLYPHEWDVGGSGLGFCAMRYVNKWEYGPMRPTRAEATADAEQRNREALAALKGAR